MENFKKTLEGYLVVVGFFTTGAIAVATLKLIYITFFRMIGLPIHF